MRATRALPATWVVGEPPTRHAVGRTAERRAEEYLARRGFRILRRRYRLKTGEIDLIALDGDTLVFVEVRARRSIGRGRPGETVDRRKRRRIVRTALGFLQRAGQSDRPCRFDVVEFVGAGNRVQDWTLSHIVDAFRA